MIKVNLKKKSYSIKKNKIDYIELKEVRYGGKWLDVIGYRLIVIAEQKFLFDFVFEDTEIEKEKQQILDLKKIFDKAKISINR